MGSPPISLRVLAIGAAKLELLAYGAGQVLRLASNLLLSRLLFPEAFGLSVTVGLVSQGLVMLSNVGVSQCIVQSPRGADPVFLNTARTMLICRGWLIWGITVLLGYPLALILRQPDLAILIPLGALSVPISSFSNTCLFTMRRDLRVRPILTIELASQIVTLIANLALAWSLRSVWSLVIAGLIGSVYSCVASHLVSGAHRDRLSWDKTAWNEIYRFGRWIQASSTLCFISGQADRFLVAHYVNMSVLGVYNFALLLSEAISTALMKLTRGVFFPVFSQINREHPERLGSTYYKIRLRADLLTLVPIGFAAAFSQIIIDLLFDARYADAGWMMRLLCVRAAMVCMLAPTESLLFACGLTKYQFYRDLARTIWMIIGIPIGWHFFDLVGLISVVALSELPVAVVLIYGVSRLGYLRIEREIFGVVTFCTSFLVALSLILAGGR